MVSASPISPPKKDRYIDKLTSEVAYRTRLQKICNRINAAANLDEILINLKDDITSLFEAERVTVYVVDRNKHQLVSRFKSGDDIEEIRIPVSAESVAGWCALKHSTINIKDAYNPKELALIDSALRFDKSWDLKTGFRTRQILARPIGFRNRLLGVIQLMNRKSGQAFVPMDEKSLEEVANILGIALHTQQKLTERYTMGKFDYLLENHLLTHQELERGIVLARQKKRPIEMVLMSDIKIPKKDILSALAKYYHTEAIEFTNDMMAPEKLLAGLKIPFLRTNCWIPLREDDDGTIIAIDNPHDQQKINEIKSLFPGRSLKFCVALKRDIIEMINFFFRDAQQQDGIEEILSVMKEETQIIEEPESEIDEEDSMVVKLVNKIILDAHDRGASDIHIEPFPGQESTQVRTRVDGDCVVYQTIPFSYRNAVISRIKIMSDLDIAERRKPQDGKIKFKKTDGQVIE
ncbi:MAG: ATPase, T2SS/T4P/T4SS family, partial [Desulfobacterales bacterium]